MTSLLRHNPFLLLVFPLFLLLGCKEEEEEIQPQVRTSEITNVLPTKATLNGEIIATGKYAILDHGFVYSSQPGITADLGVKISLGKDARVGPFTADLPNLETFVQYSSSSTPTLYARAYITTEKGTILGQVASVKLPSPSITSIAPMSGKAGDKITITGEFYTNNPADIRVTFANATAKVVEASPTAVIVEVPSGISFDTYTGKQVMVRLKVAGKDFNVTPSFHVISSVNDYSPKAGPVGTYLSIKGDNLPAYTFNSSVKVFIGQQQVSANVYSSTEIRTNVPYTLTTEKAAVSVVIDGITTVLPEEFIVTPHTITAISPASGLAGSTLYITGTNLPDMNTPGNGLSVRIGDLPATVTHAGYNQVGVTVPQNIFIGSHKVTVTLGPYTVEAPQEFEVLAPNVTGFSPASAGIGKEITLYGIFQPGKYYTVYFGMASATSSAATANSIKVIVPVSAPAGEMQLSVLFGNQRLYTADDFTVLEPSISFTPASGASGSTVTINTANFSPGYYTAVRFGTVPAQVLSYTASSMRVVVPANVTGAVKLNVLHSGRTITSSEDFTVTE